MKYRDKQLGVPLELYKATKAQIQSLPSPVKGMIAYATDTNELGTYNGTSWDWGTGGGGGSPLNIWESRAAPTSTHSFSDEFDDESLTGWTVFDPNENLTVTETINGVEMVITGGTEECLAIYKGVPSVSEFSIWTKVHMISYYDKGFKAGFFLGEHSTMTTTSDWWVFNYSIGINHYTQVERLNGYFNDFHSGYLNDERPPQFNSMYMRLRIKKLTSTARVWLDTSLDGVSWFNMSYKLGGGGDDYYTTHYVPQSMGLFVKRTFSDSGLSPKAIFPFFRVYENIDLTYVPRGRRV